MRVDEKNIGGANCENKAGIAVGEKSVQGSLKHVVTETLVTTKRPRGPCTFIRIIPDVFFAAHETT